MTDEREWYAGVDWASESHHVFLTDDGGRRIGEKIFKHNGEGLAEMAAWLMAMSGVAEPHQINIAIEVPHGLVVETLMERGSTYDPAKRRLLCFCFHESGLTRAQLRACGTRTLGWSSLRQMSRPL
ncbi:MAG: transposase [Rhodospirillales bacterium]|nr:transposase [Rhodospirillales bacterium]